MPPHLKNLRLPHIHCATSSAHLFWGSCAALLPLWISAVTFYRFQAVAVFFGAMIGAQLGGWTACRFFRKPWRGSEGQDLFLSLLFSLLLPPNTPILYAGLGSFVMIFFLKECTGGTGAYLLSPFFAAALWIFHGTVVLISETRLVWPGLLWMPTPEPQALGNVYFPALCMTYTFLVMMKRLSWELPWIFMAALGLAASGLGMNWTWAGATHALLFAILASLDWSTLPIQRRGRQISLLFAGIMSAWLGEGAYHPAGWMAGILLANIFTPWMDEFIRAKRIQNFPVRSRA